MVDKPYPTVEESPVPGTSDEGFVHTPGDSLTYRVFQVTIQDPYTGPRVSVEVTWSNKWFGPLREVDPG